MILDYYRIFYYVAQYKSFSKAADVMGNNQPNITRCMNILENDLGCKLFIRSNRGVQLTIEGERLFEHVSIAIEQLVSGENELLKDKGLESGLVNIGASEIALRLFLLNELEVFHHHYPHVKLRISNHSTPQAVQALENGLVDFAVPISCLIIKNLWQTYDKSCKMVFQTHTNVLYNISISLAILEFQYCVLGLRLSGTE